MVRLRDLCPYLCAAVLIFSAGMKAVQVIADPSFGILLGSRLVQISLIALEAILAAWLISGWAWDISRRVTLLTFACFGSYAAYLVVSGAESCGCFGAIRMPPWITVVLDWVICILLVVSRHARPIAASRRAAFAIISVAGMVVAAAAGMPHDAAADGVVVGDSFVLLEPEKWIGRTLPIINEIDIGERLSKGNWTVMLYHGKCAKCQQLLSEYNSGNRRFDGQAAFIEVPPLGPTHTFRKYAHGRLTGDKEWIVTTPTEILLRDGRVMRSGEGAARWGSPMKSRSIQ